MAAKLAEPNQLKYSTASKRVRHPFVVKALGGRGRQLGAHWEWLYPLMLIEFRRLRRAGVNMSNQLVAEMGVVFIEDSEHHFFNARLAVNGKPFTSLLTPRRIRDFLERNNIVYRCHKGKKQVNEEKQMEINRAVARHLGCLKRPFQDGSPDPEHQYNMDESHFVIDLDDGNPLDFVEWA
ncbi:hypothetical protein PF001_g8870 [Phytophthora fragariae]|uniref:Uncharacterized protein n=1 Tax=Phytophthora fragariae TaxID=53985 RepID=A0A6A4DUQ5_9STRA|nr:hypothetical protein PF001_g8870 [Phytophthora fragariae]